MNWIIALVIFLLLSAPTSGQQTRLLVADASSSGTYALMLAEIKDVCATDDFIIEEGPKNGGATENLEALKNNQVSAAFLHSDVIYARALSDPSYKELKTLVALYPEEIHILALRNSKTTAGGVGGYFAKAVVLNSLADLAGRNVGAAGGGVITARVLTGQGQGHFNVIELGSGKEVLDALLAAKIDAAIFVGGSPLPNISQLSADVYKLIPIGDTIAGNLSGVSVYKSAIINYSNLKSGPIKTMAPTATLLTRKYTTAKMIAPQAAFRQCFYDNLDALKETPGKHPKWQLVDPADHGGWEWYDMPTATAQRKK